MADHEVPAAKVRRVISSHRPAYPNPIRCRPGDRVSVGTKQSEWPGWLWCTVEDGKAAWVPEAYLDRQGNTARLLREYDSTELDAEPGDQVTTLTEESSWVWCRKQDGRTGWLPVNVLEPLQNE